MATLQVLSVDCESHPSIVVLTTENGRVVFDAGEGAQRLAVEHKVRIGKMSHIFLTSHRQSSLGGLPGMLLTLFDAGVTDIQLTGTAMASRFLSSTSLFMRPFNRFAVVDSQHLYRTTADKVIITAVPVLSAALQVERVCYCGFTPEIVGKFLVAKAEALGVPKGPQFGKLKGGATITLPDGRVVRPADVLEDPEPGKHFAIIAAIAGDELDLLEGLCSSRHWHRYQHAQGGADIMHTMVHMSPASAIDTAAYQQWMAGFGSSTQHIFIGHGCCHPHSSFVASSLHRYGLHSSSADAFAPVRNLSGASTSTFLQQMQQAGNNRFMPGTALMKVHLAPARKVGVEDVLTEALAAVAETRTEVEARIPVARAMIENGRHSVEQLMDADLRHKLDVFGQDRVIFLGTGCAIPSKYRNVSGILYYAAGTRSAMVMDAGEGTWFQLISICPSVVCADFAPTSAAREEEERKLAWATVIRAVWISHAHADHHLGLITLITERKRSLLAAGVDRFTPLVVIAPMPVIHFLQEISASVAPELEGGYIAVPSQLFDPTRYCAPCALIREDSLSSTNQAVGKLDLVPAEGSDDQSTVDSGGQPVTKRQRTVLDFSPYKDSFTTACDVLASMGMQSLQCIPVIHCPQAFALLFNRFQGSTAMKVAYSGDTRPSDLFVQYGAGATLVIHEATFEDDKQDEAVQKRHCTINEALEVGERMGAYRTILTHFSQRYHGVPQQLDVTIVNERVSDFHRALASKAVSASDFMCLRVADFPWAPVLTSALLELFPPPAETNEDVAAMVM